jgi:tyramine---L-glutamate ligase
MSRRLFLYEYTCAVAGGADTLQSEGRAMLAAVAEDFGRIPGVTVVTLLHPHSPALPPAEVVRCDSPDEEAARFRELAAAADHTLVIAPEFDDLLLTRCRWVAEAGGRLLGPSPDAVALTADKLALGWYLTERGIPTPACRPYVEGELRGGQDFPLVWKPRYGAGSQATFLVRSAADLSACAAAAGTEGYGGEAIIQPFVPGTPASVAFLVGTRQRLALLPAEQHLATDGRFRYLGGALPLAPHLAERAVRLAERAVDAVEGVRGYVGVDVVLGDAADASGDCVIEINPRLTTSYVGLRALAVGNLPAVLLAVGEGRAPTPLTWRQARIQFRADGTTGESP